MPESLLSADTWIALLSLTAMEVVLGIDNIVFIAILVGRLPPEQREGVRRLGIGLALVMRLCLLFGLTWIMGLVDPLFSLFDHPFSGRDLILIGGGLLLIGKSSHEMFDKLEGGPPQAAAGGAAQAGKVLFQILLLDIVFSLDSVITAVGMAQQLWIMVTATIAAVAVMLMFAKTISDFVDRHPSLKILALSFLLLIGVLLVADGFGQHISKGYIYFAMGFALAVEALNMRLRKVQQPVHLHEDMQEPKAE